MSYNGPSNDPSMGDGGGGSEQETTTVTVSAPNAPSNQIVPFFIATTGTIESQVPGGEIFGRLGGLQDVSSFAHRGERRYTITGEIKQFRGANLSAGTFMVDGSTVSRSRLEGDQSSDDGGGGGGGPLSNLDKKQKQMAVAGVVLLYLYRDQL